MTSSRPCSVHIGPALAAYGFPGGHPFSTKRHDAFWHHARALGLDARVDVHAPVMANDDELARFHTRAYIELVKARSELGHGLLDQGDTPAFKGCYEAAAHVVGSVLDATRRIVEGEHRRAFVPIAGLHHARRHTAGGFCIFNDIGVVIETLRAVHGIQKVAYVDIDAHHGDGVYYDFEDDPDLCFADLHQDPRTLYPGTGFAEETGRGPAKGTKLNLPLPPGASEDELFALWPEIEGFVEDARPDFVILQCGADSLAGDPLTGLRLSARCHGHAAKELRALADRLGHGRVLALGGGGYHLGNLAEAWSAVLAALV